MPSIKKLRLFAVKIILYLTFLIFNFEGTIQCDFNLVFLHILIGLGLFMNRF
jgi:hypothetical protein